MAEMGEDQQWIRASLAGDEAAFAELVKRHQRMIHAVTYRMTGSLEAAEDLAQEAFIRAFQQLETFRSESKFSTWLCRIAVNGCLNWRQREGRRSEIHQQWANEAGQNQGHDSAPSTSELVQEALGQLPAKQRAAIVLTTYEGMSHAEAARVLGCSETTVSWRLFAARGKLRKLLKQLSRNP